MRKLVAAAVIAATAATSACSRDRTEDGGPAAARNYQVGNFEGIEVAGPYDVDGPHRHRPDRFGARPGEAPRAYGGRG